MKAFKKKTLALVLASVVSIAGSFASDNYKNSLMGLDFLPTNNGTNAMYMIVQTRTNYTGNVVPTKKDENTYVLMLPEVESKMAIPNITKYQGYIKDISIRTMPYTNTGKGYTKITITTNNVQRLFGHNRIFIPSNTQEVMQIEERVNNEERSQYTETNYRKTQPERESYTPKYKTEEQTYQVEKKQEQIVEEKPSIETTVSETSNEIPDVTSPMAEKNSIEVMLLVLGVFLIIAVTAFSYLRAKDRLREIAGENFEIDVTDDDVLQKKNQKTKKIKDTIKKLDSAYAQTAVSQKASVVKPVPVIKSKPEEELNIVDLDELFKETVKTSETKKQTEEEENLALEEFLSGFSFDENIVPVMENSVGYDLEFYDELLSKKVAFTNDDIECINKLLNSEIEDSTLQNIDKYLVSNPIRKVPSKEKILEEMVATYTISQNILFTQSDVEALRKLLSVELDPDFVTDLRTNPERVEKMRKEIESFNSESKKPVETKTLIVSDLLPDLSEAVRKQAGKKIQSEVKAETVYFSEGYDVSTIKVDLPDISKEINNESAYISKPSAKYDIVDNSYEVQKLSINSELPDLKDALAHPEKYERKVEIVEVDEKALLKNISNVQFKPFYEGQEFEVLNHFEDVQKEMNQFDNFEVVEDTIVSPVEVNEYDDFESLYSNEYVDLDNPEKSTFKEEQPAKPNSQERDAKPVLNRKIQALPKRERTAISEELLNKIASRRAERKQLQKVDSDSQKDTIKQEFNKKQTKNSEIKCIFAGESYNVLSSVEMIPNVGCHLAQNGNGYTVLGYVGDKICALKQYDELKSEKIQARKNEDLSDGVSRYIVRIGMVKFIVNVKPDNIEYVMDLC